MNQSKPYFNPTKGELDRLQLISKKKYIGYRVSIMVKENGPRFKELKIKPSISKITKYLLEKYDHNLDELFRKSDSSLEKEVFEHIINHK